jgi:tetrahydromethanopterin S-methyltransferase subunit A
MRLSERQASALRLIREHLTAAVAAPKCHPCGCLQQTVEALASTRVGQDETGALLDEARAIFQPTCYDCPGCPVCPPAIAANALSEAFPEASAGLPLCPTDDPAERTRIVVSTANKANLEYEQAAPPLAQGLIRSVSGLF